MQSITTDYTVTAQGQGRVNVHTWYGFRRINWDAALDSDGNHRAAVEKVIADINKDRGTTFRIVASAPAPGPAAGWVFIIDNTPEYMPLYMTISVVFKPGTNTGPAYMKAYSWLFPKGVRVPYSPESGSDMAGASLYAANVMLDMINEKVKEHGLKPYVIWDYNQDYKGDRVFTLR